MPGKYDLNKSESKRYMDHLFGEISLNVSVQMAEYCAHMKNIQGPNRNEKRTKPELYRWYDQCFNIIKPVIDNFVVEDKKHNFYGIRKKELENNN